MAEAKTASRANLVNLLGIVYTDQTVMKKEIDEALKATNARIPSVTCDEANETLIITTGESDKEK